MGHPNIPEGFVPSCLCSLYVDKMSMVVPIPCIVGTGAPNLMILGEGASTILQSYGVIPHGEISMIIKGTFKKNGIQVTNPAVSLFNASCKK